jgi:hypothetical protein
MPGFFAATDAAAYETFTGRWSLRLARPFLASPGSDRASGCSTWAAGPA